MDTAVKRAQALMFDLPWRGSLPAPTGTVGDAARRHLVGKYSALTAAFPQPVLASTLRLTGEANARTVRIFDTYERTFTIL